MTLEIVAARIQQLEAKMERAIELLEEKETKPKGAKKPKAAKAEKPEKPKAAKAEKPEKPKAAKAEKPKRRGMTGYLKYASVNRPGVKAEMMDGGVENPKPTEVVTEVARRWKALSDEEREEWNARAKEGEEVEVEVVVEDNE